MAERKNLPPPQDPNNLVCSRCELEKPKDQFYKTTNHYCESRGYSYICKECSQKSARESRMRLHPKKEVDDETKVVEG